MYNDNTRRNGAVFFDGGDKDKCFPYSILAKSRQQQQQQQKVVMPSAVVSGNCYQNFPPAIPAGHLLSTDSPFYGNAMITDVGICFSMSNVNLNSDFPPYLGHPSLSVLGRTTRNSSPPIKPRSMPPPQQPFKARNSTPPTLPNPTPLYPTNPQLPQPYPPYPYFAHPKIPIKIYNNHTYPFLPDPTTSASTASVAAAYGQQLNNYYNPTNPTIQQPTPPNLGADPLPTFKRRQNAKKTLLNNQYYGICAGVAAAAQLPPPHPEQPPIKLAVIATDQPQDFSIKKREVETMEVDSEEQDQERLVQVEQQQQQLLVTAAIATPTDEGRRRVAAPKKKWIRHYLKGKADREEEPGATCT